MIFNPLDGNSRARLRVGGGTYTLTVPTLTEEGTAKSSANGWLSTYNYKCDLHFTAKPNNFILGREATNLVKKNSGGGSQIIAGEFFRTEIIKVDIWLGDISLSIPPDWWVSE